MTTFGIKIYWDLFLLGVLLASGPCILYCAPIILPYIAGTKKSLIEGLKSIFTFILARAAVYVALGFLAGLIGRLVLVFFYKSENIVSYSIGGMIIFLGIITMLGKTFYLAGNVKAPALLGIIAGLLPCPPLLGVLSYIVAKSRSIIEAGMLALSFGLGGLVSPLIFLGMIAGGIPAAFSRNKKIYAGLRIICGAILVVVGLRFIVQRFLV
ncbi:MAG: sulfite exporter TauE/SafE family protein [Candidatus Omnitrophota bacterium]